MWHASRRDQPPPTPLYKAGYRPGKCQIYWGEEIPPPPPKKKALLLAHPFVKSTYIHTPAATMRVSECTHCDLCLAQGAWESEDEAESDEYFKQVSTEHSFWQVASSAALSRSLCRETRRVAYCQPSPVPATCAPLRIPMHAVLVAILGRSMRTPVQGDMACFQVSNL